MDYIFPLSSFSFIQNSNRKKKKKKKNRYPDGE